MYAHKYFYNIMLNEGNEQYLRASPHVSFTLSYSNQDAGPIIGKEGGHTPPLTRLKTSICGEIKGCN